MQTILWISLGAAVGANLRYFVARQIGHWTEQFPYGTLVVNFTGSLILGFFLIWATDRVPVDTRWRLLIAVAFCGGYTTYSSFAFETFALFEQGHWLAAAWNVVATNILCLAGVVAGVALARNL